MNGYWRPRATRFSTVASRWTYSSVMAAVLEPIPPCEPELRDLRTFSAVQLESLLNEEAAEWRSILDWDFGRSADLVRRFVDLRALNGAVLLEGRICKGYCYYV